MTNKKIGIMGGTFDPIHYGHLVIANEVLDKYNMERIVFIPAGRPPHKKGPQASSQDRFFMTNLATLSNDRFIVSDIEIKKPEMSYTINTITTLTRNYENAELYFITGMDALVDLPNWYRADELLKLCKFIAVKRPGYNTLEIEKKFNEILDKYNEQIELLQVPMLQISSTDIRKRIQTGRSVKYLLPDTVEDYIIKNKLYTENILND